MARGEQPAFASNGHESFPNTFEDERRISQISQMSVQIVRRKRQEYERFLQRGDIMTRARKLGGHVLKHLEFEDEYNKGDESFRVWIETKKIERWQNEAPTEEIDTNELKRMLEEGGDEQSEDNQL